MVSSLRENLIQTEMKNLLYKAVLEFSWSNHYDFLTKILKQECLNSFFLKYSSNWREVTGSSFNHVSHILCILEIAPI